MSSKEKKNSFNWKPGDHLSGRDYDQLGNIGQIGKPKLTSALHADPVERKKVRKKKLNRSLQGVRKEFLIEGSESGLSGVYEPIEASRLIEKKSKGMKGLNLFKDSPAKNKK